MNSYPPLHDYIASLGLHIRSLQRSGLKFDSLSEQRVRTASELTPAQRLAVLRRESEVCRRCHLCSSRTHVVFGEGSAEARLMFVGAAPDDASDAQGRAFAGESGQLLTRIIEAIKMQREQVYLTTAVKCLAPPDDPGDAAIETCRPFLQRQIEIIQPEIICALGPVAARVLQYPADQKNTPVRGIFYPMGGILVMPTHHPELLLRRPELKKHAWDDVRRIQHELESGLRGRQ